MRRWQYLLALTFTLGITVNAHAQIGLSELKLGALAVTLVYPTDVISTKTSFGSFTLDVARDAPIANGASRRLIVMSHGTGGSPSSDHTMAASFVAGGFIVAQPVHEGDNFRDSSRAGPSAWAARTAEVSALIDALATHPQWRGAVRLDRVGVHGMSAGGGTAISLAGGRWNIASLVKHCATNVDTDPGFCFNGVPDPGAQAQRKEQYMRAKGVPDAFLPDDLKRWNGGTESDADPRMDQRIAVVTTIVPVAAIFSKESLARIKIPIGIVGAQADTMLNPQFHSDYVVEQCRSCTLLDSVPYASHLDMLHPLPASVAAQTARAHPYGTEVNSSFDHTRRVTAYRKIVDFHRVHLDEVK